MKIQSDNDMLHSPTNFPPKDQKGKILYITYRAG
jgi:hypothetical protein